MGALNADVIPWLPRQSSFLEAIRTGASVAGARAERRALAADQDRAEELQPLLVRRQELANRALQAKIDHDESIQPLKLKAEKAQLDVLQQQYDQADLLFPTRLVEARTRVAQLDLQIEHQEMVRDQQLAELDDGKQVNAWISQLSKARTLDDLNGLAIPTAKTPRGQEALESALRTRSLAVGRASAQLAIDRTAALQMDQVAKLRPDQIQGLIDITGDGQLHIEDTRVRQALRIFSQSNAAQAQLALANQQAATLAKESTIEIALGEGESANKMKLPLAEAQRLANDPLLGPAIKRALGGQTADEPSAALDKRRRELLAADPVSVLATSDAGLSDTQKKTRAEYLQIVAAQQVAGGKLVYDPNTKSLVGKGAPAQAQTAPAIPPGATVTLPTGAVYQRASEVWHQLPEGRKAEATVKELTAELDALGTAAPLVVPEHRVAKGLPPVTILRPTTLDERKKHDARVEAVAKKLAAAQRTLAELQAKFPEPPKSVTNQPVKPLVP